MAPSDSSPHPTNSNSIGLARNPRHHQPTPVTRRPYHTPTPRLARGVQRLHDQQDPYSRRQQRRTAPSPAQRPQAHRKHSQRLGPDTATLGTPDPTGSPTYLLPHRASSKRSQKHAVGLAGLAARKAKAKANAILHHHTTRHEAVTGAAQFSTLTGELARQQGRHRDPQTLGKVHVPYLALCLGHGCAGVFLSLPVVALGELKRPRSGRRMAKIG